MSELTKDLKQSKLRSRGDSEGKKVKLILDGLNCASCAEKINTELLNQKFIDLPLNFATKAILADPNHLQEIQKLVDSIESGVTVRREDTDKRKGASFLEAVKDNQGDLLKVLISAILLAIGIIYGKPLHGTPLEFVEYTIFIAAYILVGGKVVLKAFRNLAKGQVFDENFLMTIATFGAFAIYELPEAVGVMLFYAVGEFLQDVAVNRSRRSIADLMNIRPDYANIYRAGELVKVDPESVEVGEIIVVKPGEKVPLDGEVVEGGSFVDTSALTGESVPRKIIIGDNVLAGSVNTSGLVKIRVSKTYGESSVSKILELVENAGSRKAHTEQFITKFARYYTPAVVFVAIAIAVVPPLIVEGATFQEWVYRALTILVISCPCALVVSVPLGYFGGIGGASSKGILIKGANYLEALTDLHTIALDKTGTITKGIFEVTNIQARNGFEAEEILKLAAMAEIHSSHPIAKSIIRRYGQKIAEAELKVYEDIPGCGIKAMVEGQNLLVGNGRLLETKKIAINPEDREIKDGTVVYVAVDGVYAGYLVISDEIKEDSYIAINELRKQGIKDIVMLTGDHSAVAQRVANELGIDKYFAELLPGDKIAKVEELEAALGERRKVKVAFVGDGINDAPVLSKSDIGIAMGGLGSDAAIEAADVVIMEDKLSKIATAVGIAKSTRKVIVQNIAFAIVVKGIFIALGALGVASMWEAVFADVGVTILAVLNATRTLKYNG